MPLAVTGRTGFIDSNLAFHILKAYICKELGKPKSLITYVTEAFGIML